MKKSIALIFLLSLIQADDNNIGFLMNQKYICVNQGAFIEGKLVKIMSQEDALKYPSRLYVDDNRVLHTDGKVDNILKYNKNKDVYESKDSTVGLQVQEGKRLMFRMATKGQLKGIALIHICSETNNWTLAK